jgi:hypothetical protein
LFAGNYGENVKTVTRGEVNVIDIDIDHAYEILSAEQQRAEQGVGYCKGKSALKQAIELAASALEKQIPKKPINQSTWKACPTCTQGIGVDSNTPNPKAIEYCFHCGQKLDWTITDREVIGNIHDNTVLLGVK